MNNLFNFKRFGLELKKDFMENGKRYLLSFLTMLGFMVIIVIFASLENCKNHRIPANLFNKELLIYLSLIFFVCGIFFASTFSLPMNNKLKRIAYLINPASNLEKYLTRWLITTVGFILAFFLALWITEIIRITVCSILYPNLTTKILDLSKLSYAGGLSNPPEYMLPQSVFFLMISIYLLLQSTFLLGSTIWEKFIKSFTAVLILIFAYFIINRWAILFFYEGFDGYANVFRSYELDNMITFEGATGLTSIIVFVFALANWILAYFRIKESEIINRL